MKSRYQKLRLPVLGVLLCALLAALPAAAAPNAAIPSAHPGGVYWQISAPNDGVTLRVSMPDGTVFEQAYPRGQGPWFSPNAGGALPDGAYAYELVMSPVVAPQERAAAQSARASGQAASLPSGIVESGVFRVMNGVVVLPEESIVEPRAPGKPKAAPLKAGSGVALKDQVIPDDLIVQGSLCVGFDCINGESFGFDTIRLKENNTRIKFEDTSTGSFPTTDWQLTANDSASGGANKFSIEDITGAKVPFTLTAGAPTNSVFVDSSGRLGLKTAAPVLDMHIATGNTPGIRMEQNSSSGFTAQTWDIAGNEANFFIRDVTGGSRLPFRIRPNAPTSSIDISGSGNVGIGTASPTGKLHVVGTGDQISIFQSSNDGAVQFRLQTDNANRRFVALNSAGTQQSQIVFGDDGAFKFLGATGADNRLQIPAAGVLNCAAGIKTDASGVMSCIVSSQQFKTVEGELAPLAALTNVMALRPRVGSYKATPDEPEHWLIAEEVAKVDPALVGTRDGKPYTVKTQNVIADLIAVIQQQQRRIEQQERGIEQQQRRIEALERSVAKE